MTDLVPGPAATTRTAELTAAAGGWPEHVCSPAERRDLRALVDGWFAPLAGWPGPDDLVAVATRRELASGDPWPHAFHLEVDGALADRLATRDAPLALRDPEGALLAVLRVQASVPGPGGGIVVSGPVEAVDRATPADLPEARLTAAEVRSRAATGATVAVTRGWLLRPDLDALAAVTTPTGAGLVVLVADPGPDVDDVAGHARLRGVLDGARALPDAVVALAPLPVGPPGGGTSPAGVPAPDLVAGAPGFTALHVAVAAGLGAARLVVAGGVDAADVQFADRLGVELVSVDPVPDADIDRLAQALEAGTHLQPGLVPLGVEEALRRAHPARTARGVVVFLTGLSGSGKSTIARAFVARVAAAVGGRTPTLLDGDLVRRNLSSELGFSREHRDVNIRRIGWVAAEIAKHGGLAVCCPIAPYDTTRRAVREMVESAGGCFVLVHVATSIEVCEARDRKGLYARARQGLIPEFTGVSDPYEEPADAELVVDTDALAADDAAAVIERWLVDHGWIV